jgi:hypothetical protein
MLVVCWCCSDAAELFGDAIWSMGHSFRARSEMFR